MKKEKIKYEIEKLSVEVPPSFWGYFNKRIKARIVKMNFNMSNYNNEAELIQAIKDFVDESVWTLKENSTVSVSIEIEGK